MFSDPAKIISQLGLDSGQVVVDFGVGSGNYTLESSKRVGLHGIVYAVDVQSELLTKINKTATDQGLNNIKVMTANLDLVNSTKFKEESADWVIIANILFQLKNKENIIKEAKRILKKTGRMLIVDWTESFGGIGPQSSDVVTRENAQKLAENVDFKLIKTIDAGAHHYGLVFKKQ